MALAYNRQGAIRLRSGLSLVAVVGVCASGPRPAASTRRRPRPSSTTGSCLASCPSRSTTTGMARGQRVCDAESVGRVHRVPALDQREGPADVAHRGLPAEPERHDGAGIDDVSVRGQREGAARGHGAEHGGRARQERSQDGRPASARARQRRRGAGQSRRLRRRQHAQPRRSHGQEQPDERSHALLPGPRLAAQRRARRTTCPSRKAAARRRTAADRRSGEIDLGGRTIVAIDIHEHTPGSTGYLDRENKMIATGDAIGSGYVWAHFGSMTQYSEAVHHLQDVLRPFDRVDVLPAHFYQVKQGARGKPPINGRPLDKQYVDDEVRVVNGILDGIARRRAVPQRRPQRRDRDGRLGPGGLHARQSLSGRPVRRARATSRSTTRSRFRGSRRPARRAPTRASRASSRSRAAST